MKAFYFALAAVLGLMGLGAAIAVVNPSYDSRFYWFADATSESSWTKFCAHSRTFSVGGMLVWVSDQKVPDSECEEGAIITQPVAELTAECPDGNDCDPDGRFMKLMWDLQQKTAPE